jgi:hypothetical protein
VTKRATFTEAEIVRLGRAAERLGKVLVATRSGDFVFAPADQLALPSPDQSEISDYDRWKARKNEARLAKGS